jgi:hypothetical protein
MDAAIQMAQDQSDSSITNVRVSRDSFTRSLSITQLCRGWAVRLWPWTRAGQLAHRALLWRTSNAIFEANDSTPHCAKEKQAA